MARLTFETNGGPMAIEGIIVDAFDHWCYEPQAKYGKCEFGF